MNKLAAHGFDTHSLKLIHNYLSQNQQRAQVKRACSVYKDIFYGVKQGLIFGPLIFNIHLCDLFSF